MCAYPTLNFQIHYPKHTYFFIWPYREASYHFDSIIVKIISDSFIMYQQVHI